MDSPKQAKAPSTPKAVTRSGEMKLNVPTPASHITPSSKTRPDFKGTSHGH